jgi:uncharacterized membrane protein
MDTRGGDPDPGNRLLTDRMEAFSDGVFAIAITLLVLEIKIPAGSEDLLAAVLEEWPIYLGYLISFFTIGSVWITHSAITEFLDHVDPILLRINLVLLMMVGLLPVPTRLMADYFESSSGERVAVTIYGLVLLSTRLMVLALWEYGVRHHLVRPDLAVDDTRDVSAKLAPSLGGYVAALAIGLAAPRVAVVLYLVIALYLIIPFRQILGMIRRPSA